MCSGKSTLGRALAILTRMPFVDLDQAVERRAGMSIQEIFRTQGEGAFRRMERELLAEICHGDSAVIVACGGGLPCQPGAMDEMLARGQVVWLHPSADRLVARLMEGRAKRPLLAGVATSEEMQSVADKMIAERAPHYSRAHAEFDSSLLETQEEIDATARRFISQFLPEKIPINPD